MNSFHCGQLSLASSVAYKTTQRVSVPHLKLFGHGGTPILGHIRDVRPEWVSFPGRKPADGCKFLTRNLRMDHNFDVI